MKILQRNICTLTEANHDDGHSKAALSTANQTAEIHTVITEIEDCNVSNDFFARMCDMETKHVNIDISVVSCVTEHKIYRSNSDT